MSSRKSSRRSSFDKDDLPAGISEIKDEATGKKCIQAGADKGEYARDDDKIENNPGMFAAEQTWPTEEEIKGAAQRKLSGHDEMQEMETGD